MVDAKVDHYEDERHAVGNAVSSHRKVAAILQQPLVDKYRYEACSGVHGKWRHADAEDVFHYCKVDAVDASFQMKHLFRIAEQACLQYQGDGLREYSGVCRAADAHVEGIDKERVEYAVEHHGKDGDIHRLAWFACRSQHGIGAKI